jgi:chromosomal replication initiation ATPase DnaA
MSLNQQDLLNINRVISFSEEDYTVTSSNDKAWRFIKSWPHWNASSFGKIAYIHGEQGSGKSHLASIWQQTSSATCVTSAIIISKDFGDTNYWLDNVENFLQHEQNILHLFNHVVSSQKCMLITSRKHVKQLGIKLPDLLSRMGSILSIKIEQPDENMIERIVTKYFADSQILVSPKTIKYLLNRIDRSYAAMSDVLTAIDRASLLKKQRISTSLIRSLFEAAD